MAVGSSGDCFGEHAAILVVGSDAELAERVKEMIVTALSRQLPVLHGPGVDYLLKEN